MKQCVRALLLGILVCSPFSYCQGAETNGKDMKAEYEKAKKEWTANPTPENAAMLKKATENCPKCAEEAAPAATETNSSGSK